MKLFSRFLLGLLALFALAAPVPAQVVSTQAVPVLTAPNPCVIPSLSLNFVANGGSGIYCLSGRQYTSVSALPGWTFSRTGQGYAERSDGTLVLFGSGVPRITDKGLLVEEARTNLLLWSQDFSNAAWGKISGGTGSAPVVSSGFSAPDGTTTANRVQLNAGAGGTINDYSALEQSVAVASTARAVAFYLKSNTGSSYQVAIRDAATGGGITVVTVTPTWQRFSAVYTTTSPDIQLILRGTYGTSASADLLVWQADLQPGSFITSPIPTTSASATRGADSVAITGLNFAPAFTSVARLTTYDTDTTHGVRFVEFTDGTSSNKLIQYRAGSVPNQPSYTVTVGGANQVSSVSSGATMAAGVTVTSAVRIAAANYGISAGGLASVDQASGSAPPALTQLSVGQGLAGGNYANGYFSRILLYSRAFSDAELQGATQ